MFSYLFIQKKLYELFYFPRSVNHENSDLIAITYRSIFYGKTFLWFLSYFNQSECFFYFIHDFRLCFGLFYLYSFHFGYATYVKPINSPVSELIHSANLKHHLSILQITFMSLIVVMVVIIFHRPVVNQCINTILKILFENAQCLLQIIPWYNYWIVFYSSDNLCKFQVERFRSYKFY